MFLFFYQSFNLIDVKNFLYFKSATGITIVVGCVHLINCAGNLIFLLEPLS
jgi:hypothetical protein